MYVCGPTVYDFAHIGNARPIVVFDVLYRLLKRLYPKVVYVRNITDIDDKIIAAAAESGEPIDDLTARTTKAFHEDMKALGVIEPDVEPRATEHIPQMIALVEKLLARGHAYEADGHVLFQVSSDPEYGKLSHRKREEMIAGARVEVAPYKKDPADFVLWKPSGADLPGWESPWGRGRPGWHLECSAMSQHHLGETFDIHGGGQDLIFPHHENEIAQSECAHGGKTFVRYWLHNGYFTVDGEKMSKSLGNVITVRELLAKAPGEAIRYNMLGTHYRHPADWTDAELSGAKRIMDGLYQALREVADIDVEPAEELPAAVKTALEDDLNTPSVRGPLRHMAKALNKATERAEKARLKADLLAAGNALGLLQEDPETWFKWQPSGAERLDEQVILAFIRDREAARNAKDFAKADAIRDELEAKGVLLEDAPNGTTWRRAG